ncbi:MAG: integrase, partial [Vicinamibacterales bacterium]
MRWRIVEVEQPDELGRVHVIAQHPVGRATAAPRQRSRSPPTQRAVDAWIKKAGLKADDFLLPSRAHSGAHLSTRQYARIVKDWAEMGGLDASAYGTHSMRRTKASI